MITIKLEHTPLHKTVAGLVELYKPPPPPPRAEVVRRNGQSKKRKASAANGDEVGEEGATKKRRRKTASPEDPEAEGQSALKPKKARKSKPKPRPDGAEGQAQGGAEQNDPVLNLSPSEAARRRDEAIKKLADNGIDSDTLSTEQFDIFSNQSPDLQNESLAMLIKYGAERLRIVHPNKDNASTASPTPASGVTPDGSAKRKTPRKKALNPDGTPKVKKTRGSCQTCRAKKLKVGQAHGFKLKFSQLIIRSVRRRSLNAQSVWRQAFHATIHHNRAGIRTSLSSWPKASPTSLLRTQRLQPWPNLCPSLRQTLRPSRCPKKKLQIWARLGSTHSQKIHPLPSQTSLMIFISPPSQISPTLKPCRAKCRL